MALSATAYIEKNKLSSTGAWIILLKVTFPDNTVIRICRNTEDVTWPVTAGNTWVAFPFEFDEIGDSSKGEVPQFSIKIGNASRVMQAYNELHDGLVDSVVELLVVHSTNVTTAVLGGGVNNASSEIELNYKIVSSYSDSMWATYNLGAINPYHMRFPRGRVDKYFCRYKEFKGDRCAYVGAETTCDRSLSTCRDTMNNAPRFGGAPGVGRRGIYV